MAKDYFQDITPPGEPAPRRPVNETPDRYPPPLPHAEEEGEGANEVHIRIDGTNQAPKGIRSISSSRPTRSRMGGDTREAPTLRGVTGEPLHSQGSSSHVWMWGAAALALIVVAILGLIALRPTTVTVTPRSHVIVLTDATPFSAYPSATAASGTLSYIVQSIDLEDSQAVPASGTVTTPPSKASGNITVYNAYSSLPVRLIKNTRFETSDGFVFRVPAEVMVPGKKGTTPGSVQVTVVADQTGERYNVGPVARFTLPGLKSSPAMYSGVYAKSTASMSGGSSGASGPGIAPADLSAALSKLQSNLLGKARDTAVAQAQTGTIVLPELIQVAYATEPNTVEAGGGARVHESAHVQIPVFQTSQLGQMIGAAVSADADSAPVTLIPGSGFRVALFGTSPDLATGPLQFTVQGQANLIWNVDTAALAKALAGREQGAFQTVITGFPGIEEAHAKVEPFWKSTFPSNPSDIKIVVTAQKPLQQTAP